MKLFRECDYCGKQYEADQYLIKRNRNLTCSRECSYKLRVRHRTIDLTGQKFNKLTVLYRAQNIKEKIAWECLCECGNKTITTTQDLVRKDKRQKKSCGCMNYRKGEKSHAWRGKNGISLSYWQTVNRNAQIRNLEISISIEEAASQFNHQLGKCALTGWPISLNLNASLDRIDSAKGYVKENIQWLHKDINRLKSNFDEKYLIEICEAIINHEKNKDTF